MSEGFTIANFRTVAHGPQEGQFAVGERKKALGLSGAGSDPGNNPGVNGRRSVQQKRAHDP